MLYVRFCVCCICSDISVSKMNLVSITILYVTVFLRFYCISVLKYFYVSVSIVSFQIILILVFISVSITLILEL